MYTDGGARRSISRGALLYFVVCSYEIIKSISTLLTHVWFCKPTCVRVARDDNHGQSHMRTLSRRVRCLPRVKVTPSLFC